MDRIIIIALIAVAAVAIGLVLSTPTGYVTGYAVGDASHETIAVCEKTGTEDCPVLCRDYEVYRINGTTAERETQNTACHELGWADPRTGEVFE